MSLSACSLPPPRPRPTGAPETGIEEVEGPGRKSRPSRLHSSALGHLEFVRSPSYTQTTSAFVLTRTPELQPSGSWLSFPVTDFQNQARFRGETLKPLTSPVPYCRERGSCFCSGHCTVGLDGREDLAAVTLPEPGEVAPPAWTPVRHCQAVFLGPDSTGPLGERGCVIADETNGAAPGYLKVPCFSPPRSFLGHSQNLFLSPHIQGK